jgi:hypothetical protein
MAFNPLKIYLRDHLAGSRSALKMLKDLRRSHAGDEIGQLAKELHREVSSDRARLREIGKRVGVRRSLLKDAGGWIAAILSRYKLERDAPRGFGTFQKLEVLSLGIEGKKMLWTTLANAAKTDRRLAGFNYPRLCRRAAEQREKVDRLGLALSEVVLSPRH